MSRYWPEDNPTCETCGHTMESHRMDLPFGIENPDWAVFYCRVCKRECPL